MENDYSTDYTLPFLLHYVRKGVEQFHKSWRYAFALAEKDGFIIIHDIRTPSKDIIMVDAEITEEGEREITLYTIAGTLDGRGI
jgi:hypothetical protein